jgi:hypothetical protein
MHALEAIAVKAAVTTNAPKYMLPARTFLVDYAEKRS